MVFQSQMFGFFKIEGPSGVKTLLENIIIKGQKPPRRPTSVKNDALLATHDPQINPRR
jgi:hypothetical protein